MKRIVTFLLITFCFTSHLFPHAVAQDTTYPSVFYNAQRFPQGLVSPEGKSLVTKNAWVIGFDLNDVVFLPKYSQIWSQAKDHGFFTMVKTAVKAPKILLHKTYVDFKHDHTSRAWDAYLQLLVDAPGSHKNREFVDFVRTFIQKINILNLPVLHLAQELQTQGHHTIALTNMGIHFMATQKELLQKRFINPYVTNEEKSLIILLITLLSDPRSTMPSPETNWRTKPHPEIYNSFLAKNNGHTGYIGFIDDKEENVRAAIENGIDVAFVFTTPQELEKALRGVGILPAK